jgi:hypothetical protein
MTNPSDDTTVNWSAIPKAFLLFLDNLHNLGFSCEKFGSEGEMIFQRTVHEDGPSVEEDIIIEFGNPTTMTHSLSNFNDPYPKRVTVSHTPPITTVDDLRNSYTDLREELENEINKPPVDRDE